MAKVVSSKSPYGATPQRALEAVRAKTVQAGKYVWRTHKALFDEYKRDIAETVRDARSASTTPEEDKARRDRVAANVGRIAVNAVFDVLVPLSPMVRDQLRDPIDASTPAPTSAPPRSPPRRRAPTPKRGS